VTEKTSTLLFKLEDSTVGVWCDGREYDPEVERYRPRFSYTITTPEWQYVGNDIYGAWSSAPDVAGGARSLFAFLYAAQEAWHYQPRGENANMFPDHVNEWANHYSDEIGLFSLPPEE